MSGERDIGRVTDIFQFIISGEAHGDLLKAIAELSLMMAEREELMAESEWLKRRIAEEDARVMREIETRDWRWLYTGDIPAITYENDAVKRKVEIENPHEKRTAKRLRKHGIAPDFAEDEVFVKDAETGQVRKIGLADFSSGYEIKTLEEASSYNTIDGYIKNASKKKNAKALYFDNSENDHLSDDDLIGYIVKSRRFKRGSIYVLTKDESLVKIR